MTRDELVARNGRRLGIIALAFGTIIIGSHIESGSQRWSASAWAFALEVPGSPATWGAVLLAAGLLIRFSRRRRLGYWTAFLWFCSLAFAAGIALAEDVFGGTIHLVNPLAVATWTVLASMYRQQLDDEKLADAQP